MQVHNVGARGVNPRLYATRPPVLRPQDATWWRHPANELAKLAGAGIVVSPAHGLYVVVPPERLGDESWRPTLEGFALAVAQRTAGVEAAALMGVSAARLHGALPRALAVAVIAAERQRPAVQHTDWGRLHWVRRHVGGLDLQRADTDLCSGWVTTVEQTLLDVADRPDLGGLGARTVSEVLVALAARADWDVVLRLAEEQRRRAAFARARWVADGVVGDDVRRPQLPAHRDRYADPCGLVPAVPTPPAEFGVAPASEAR